jgi:hypothetical protein
VKNKQAVYVGCVMGWEPKAGPGRKQPFTFTPPVVTEFCPGHLQAGKIVPTCRMVELSIAGFKPIAIVYCDPEKADCYSLFAHTSVSAAAHQQLGMDAEAIFKAAADSTKSSGHAFPLVPTSRPRC